MMFAIFFAFWRICEIITLIIMVGLLSWFVDGFVKNNLLTPNFILILFIVSVLALAWAILTLFSYHRSSANAQFVGVVDLLFVGAFIAGVYYISFIGRYDCGRVVPGEYFAFGLGGFIQISGEGFWYHVDKPCAILKTSYAFGIMNCVFFFITAVLALIHGGHMSKKDDRSHANRHSHHRRSGSHHSHHSRRSHHSHHRAYV